jgi:hypothetical protein
VVSSATDTTTASARQRIVQLQCRFGDGTGTVEAQSMMTFRQPLTNNELVVTSGLMYDGGGQLTAPTWLSRMLDRGLLSRHDTELMCVFLGTRCEIFMM